MGRAFEFRKERKMKRWGHMARTFTKLGKEITIAVKQGGPDVTGNPRLRALMAEARSEQMPKENIERAIKKATESKQGDFKEVIYEGYGPYGIAYLVETATDNNTRTVANAARSLNDTNVKTNVTIDRRMVKRRIATSQHNASSFAHGDSTRPKRNERTFVGVEGARRYYLPRTAGERRTFGVIPERIERSNSYRPF